MRAGVSQSVQKIQLLSPREGGKKPARGFSLAARFSEISTNPESFKAAPSWRGRGQTRRPRGLRAWLLVLCSLLLWLLRVAFGSSRCPQRTLLHDADGPIVEWPKQ